MTEEKRSSDGRRRTDRIDRRKPAEKAENWLAAERRKSERREGERREGDGRKSLAAELFRASQT